MNFHFNSTLRNSAIAVALAVSASASSLPAQAFDDTEKAKIETIIRDYLLKNPEVMIEVQQALEAKQRAQQAAASKAALAQSKEVVFNSPNQGVIGNPQGSVTVVEFFDYNCGYCQRAMDDMNTLLDSDSDLKFVMKEMPILSEASVQASQISTAVYRLMPEKYGEFHNKLLSLNGAKDGNRARQVAEEMGLDLAALEAESQKEDVIDAFREANDLATRLGINGTPSYVIGDEVVFGALGAEVLREKIDNMRKCGSTTCG